MPLYNPATSGGSLATDTLADAKGDVFAATGADAIARVAVGANGQGVVADSSQSAGVKWSGTGFWDRQDAATGFFRPTLPRAIPGGSSYTVTSGVMESGLIYLEAGEIVTNIGFITGTTAATSPTHWWVALYDTQATPALVAQSADQTSTAIAANTAYTLALGSPAPYTVTTTGLHYVAFMVAASTPNNLKAANILNAATAGALVTGQKVLTQTSGSSLTTTAPSTIASGTAATLIPFMFVS